MNPAVLVNGRIEASERRNPYEILAKSMKHFRHFCPADKKVISPGALRPLIST